MARKKTAAAAPPIDKNILHKLTPLTALILGAILFISGTVFTAVSLSPAVNAIAAIEYFDSASYVRPDGEVDSNYNGHGVITSGELTYDKAGAVDAVFGVAADSPLLYRISEMYQWQQITDEDGKIEVVGVWSEELIPSPDEKHENPVSYPANMKSSSYTALAVRLGGYAPSETLLSMLEERGTLETLPEVDIRGYKTSGSYITNADDIESPEIGNVRIRYEYLSSKVVTFAGKQREDMIVAYNNYEDYDFLVALDGEHSKSDVLSVLKSEADPAVWWMLVLGAAATVIGAILLFDGFVRKTRYSPRIPALSAKMSEITSPRSAYIYSAVLGVLTFALTIAISWASIYPLPTLFLVVAALIYLYILIGDMIKHMPRYEKKEAEYVPILIKREDDKRRK